MKLLIALSVLVAAVSAGTQPLVEVMPYQDLEGRITNGEVASDAQFPYQAALRLGMEGGYAFCGGSILSDEWILTAAHCTDVAHNVTVTVGVTKLSGENEKFEQKIFVTSKNIYVHDGWNPSTLTNDIALIRLSAKIQFNEHTQPAVLPKNNDGDYVGDLVWASGWGKDSDSATAVSPVLRFIEVPVLKSQTCSTYYLGVITEKMICISTKGHKSTCNGDSGGPLVLKQDDQNILIGATSFGIALGCEKGWPGVFTRVPAYLDWIHAKTGLK